jgi:hypothetical protein
VVAIVYPDGQRMLRSIDSVKKDCELNVLNPRICSTFKTIIESMKEGGG